jgi:hypothetical protein
MAAILTLPKGVLNKKGLSLSAFAVFPHRKQMSPITIL